MKNILLVAAGGGLGSAARYAFSFFYRAGSFPFVTLLINIFGSFLLGVLMGISLSEAGLKEEYKLLFGVGFCGGFTTFSAFSLENLKLLQAGKYTLFFIYVGLSVTSGLLAAWLGFKITNQ